VSRSDTDSEEKKVVNFFQQLLLGQSGREGWIDGGDGGHGRGGGAFFDTGPRRDCLRILRPLLLRLRADERKVVTVARLLLLRLRTDESEGILVAVAVAVVRACSPGRSSDRRRLRPVEDERLARGHGRLRGG